MLTILVPLKEIILFRVDFRHHSLWQCYRSGSCSGFEDIGLTDSDAWYLAAVWNPSLWCRQHSDLPSDTTQCWYITCDFDSSWLQAVSWIQTGDWRKQYTSIFITVSMILFKANYKYFVYEYIRITWIMIFTTLAQFLVNMQLPYESGRFNQWPIFFICYFHKVTEKPLCWSWFIRNPGIKNALCERDFQLTVPICQS